MRNNLSDVMQMFASRKSERAYSEKPLSEEEISALISIGNSGPGSLDLPASRPNTLCYLYKNCIYEI